MSQIPKVLGFKVLVRPDGPDDVTASGLVVVSDSHHVPVSGQVVGIGPDGSEQGYRARQEALRDALKIVAEVESEWNFPACLQIARENVARLLGTGAECDVKIGDRVVFPQECGATMTVDGETYLVLKLDDICVVMGDEVAA